MQRTCIAVVDAAHARLFLFDRSAEATGLHEELVETTDLVNPARRLTQGEQLTESRPGSGRVGTRGFAYDDHRGARTDELDRAFAKSIAQELQRLTVSPQVQRLILCASPRMLGELRQAARTFERGGLEVAEVARDLVKLTPPELRERLGEYGLLPA
ncbi:MAG: host attachment protein [Myxococcales bacterium]|nr:host attachment protein [Myxococcales bacterium]